MNSTQSQRFDRSVICYHLNHSLTLNVNANTFVSSTQDPPPCEPVEYIVENQSQYQSADHSQVYIDEHTS